MIGYADCFSGVSGDMLLGALVDAGLELDELRRRLAGLAVSGYEINAETRVEGALRGCQLSVHADAEQPERTLSDIERILRESALDPTVVERASAVFRRLARAESSVHGVPLEAVHFHEVGAVDSIVDIVGVIVGLELLGVEKLYASSLPLGGGSVNTRHGIIPLPAPATLQLLAEVGAPTRPMSTDRELVTPTGAALLAELAEFVQPPMRLERVGCGFGRRRLAWPNCLRLWLGAPLKTMAASETVAVLEANIDDMNPEGLGFAMERLFQLGALDVYFQPLQMKKNRPGVLLGVVARPAQAEQLAQAILVETSTLGVRVSEIARYVAARSGGTVLTRFGTLSVKVKEVGGIRSMTPEYEDAARLARQHGVPLSEVYREVARLDPPKPAASAE